MLSLYLDFIARVNQITDHFHTQKFQNRSYPFDIPILANGYRNKISLNLVSMCATGSKSPTWATDQLSIKGVVINLECFFSDSLPIQRQYRLIIQIT